MSKTNLPAVTSNDVVDHEKNLISEFFYDLGFRDSVLTVVSIAITQQLKKENITPEYYLNIIANWSTREIQQLVVKILNENRIHSSVLSYRLRT